MSPESPKITLRSVQEHEQGLGPGDKIAYTVTHELKINGESSWVKYGATVSVREGESSQDAHNRVQTQVDGQMEKVVMATVKFVEDHS